MKAKLIVVGGDAKAVEINLKLPAIIGRGREASLTLPHKLVSRQHCEIYDQDGQLVVRDMGSLNGTYVNNHKIEEATYLPTGDLLTIGTVTFRAVYGDDLEQETASTVPAAQTNAEAVPAAQQQTSPTESTAPVFEDVEDVDDIEEVDDVEDVEEVDFTEFLEDDAPVGGGTQITKNPPVAAEDPIEEAEPFEEDSPQGDQPQGDSPQSFLPPGFDGSASAQGGSDDDEDLDSFLKGLQ